MIFPKIPFNIKSYPEPERGQALVELMVVILISLMVGIGIYEAGAFFHNVSVINRAVETGASYASYGADFETVRDVIHRETLNLISGAFLSQFIPEQGVIVEVWNPISGNKLAPSSHADEFPPNRRTVAEYMFRAQGYEIRVGVIYRIGITVPLVRNIVVEQTIVGTRAIQTPNDIDRDGFVDSQEGAYLQWRTGGSWDHPVHRDQADTMDTTMNADIDGDGLAGNSDTFPYDFNNNGVEDKFDEDNRSGPSENDLQYHPRVGPNDWPSLP